jgi:hypothetical protein
MSVDLFPTAKACRALAKTFFSEQFTVVYGSTLSDFLVSGLYYF